MELVILIVVILSFIVLSNLLARLVPVVSLPIHQIFLGAIFGLMPLSHIFELEAELFLLIFVAPLLFMDSQHVSNKELWKHKFSILSMSLALVFVTVLIAGPVISFLIPGLPLAGAFALAAILSPTDPVAVKAIFAKLNVPHGLKIVLEGESLINDAAGLVTFKFALAAVVTGAFSIWDASIDFLQVSLGGIAVGLVVMAALMLVTKILMKLGVADANVYASIRLAAPFIVFLAAEEMFGFSGILAVVCAGIVSSAGHAKVIGQQEARIRFASEGAWSVLLFILNGFVFIILGIHLPEIVESRLEYGAVGVMSDLGLVVLVYLTIMLIRFVWVMLFIERKVKKALIATLSGVKGAITLAAAFSIPFTVLLQTGETVPFFERDLILFICGGVIILSIISASILLPLVSTKSSGKKELMEHGARKRLISTATQQEVYELGKNSEISMEELAHKVHHAEKEMIKHLYRKGEIDKETRIRLELDIALEEVMQFEDELQEYE